MSFFALMRDGSTNALERRKPMDEQIIATYCLCDHLLQAIYHHADAKVR
jgi:hypothetical protein